MRNLVSIFLFLVLCGSTFAQADKKFEKDLYSSANEHMYNENYLAAQETYLKLLELAPRNDQYLLETGLSYFFATKNRDQSIKYFELAKNNSRADTLTELYYYLGRGYQLDSQFDKAIKYYSKFKTFLKDNKSGRKMAESVEEDIRKCQHGQYHLSLFAINPVVNSDQPIQDLTKYFVNDSTYVAIENFGKKLNSPFADYTPLILNKNNYIAFTSRREKLDKNIKPLFDGQYFENIYVARMADGEWKEPVEIQYSSVFGQAISNHDNSHDAVIYINQDENIMLMYKQGKLSMSTRGGTKWSGLIEFDENINDPSALQSSAAITNDGKTLYVVSQRKKGYGGRDIYVSTLKDDGTWSEMENLGAVINTEHDEESPYISEDGNTLYFSSKGHSSMGGFDIFVSQRKENGKWDTPSSLGVPINSPMDEIYYIPGKDLNRAYYASSRSGGYGDIDLYTIYKGIEKRKLSVQDSLLIASKLTPKEKELFAQTVTIERDNKMAMSQLMEEEEIVYEERPDETSATTELIEKTTTLQEKEELLAQKQAALQELKDSLDNQKEIALAETTEVEEKLETEETVEEAIETTQETVEETVAEVVEETTEEVVEVEKETVEEVVEVEKETVEEVAEVVEEKVVEVKEVETVETPVTPKTPSTTKIPSAPKGSKSIPQEVLTNLAFNFNSNSLNEENKKQLGQLADYIKNNQNVKLTLNGHADYLGSDELNLQVSKERARMVYSYLVEQGTDPNQLALTYSGEHKPLVPGQNPDGSDNPENRAKNRRVEMDVVEYELFRFVLFGFDSYALTNEANQHLEDVVDFLKAYPDKKVSLNGHTDLVGNVDYNKYLAGKRIQSVYEYLLDNGISADRMVKNPMGVDDPVVPEGSGFSQKYNRRVEILVK